MKVRGMKVLVGVVAQAVLQVGDEHGAEELALVLVQALHLHVEHGVRVQLKALRGAQIVGEGELVIGLDLLQAQQHLVVVLEFAQAGRAPPACAGSPGR